MSRMSKLRVCLMALVLGLVGLSGTYAQSAASQSQSSPGQEPTQPTQAQQPAKSPDDNGANEDQLPTSPVVAGTLTNAPLSWASAPITGPVGARSHIIPIIFFFEPLDV